VLGWLGPEQQAGHGLFGCPALKGVHQVAQAHRAERFIMAGMRAVNMYGFRSNSTPGHRRLNWIIRSTQSTSAMDASSVVFGPDRRPRAKLAVDGAQVSQDRHPDG
jgi:hypothetical protein